MTEWTLRVLLIADTPAEATLLIWALERAGLAVIAERINSRAAFRRALTTFAPDGVIGDPVVLGLSTDALLEQLRTLRPTAPLIVAADALDGPTAAAYLRAGVDDLVLKSDFSRLGSALQAARALRAPLARLSLRQVAVFRLVATGVGAAEIARRLGVNPKTVAAHRRAVMRRLRIHHLAGLTRYALRVGLVPPAGAPASAAPPGACPRWTGGPPARLRDSG